MRQLVQIPDFQLGGGELLANKTKFAPLKGGLEESGCSQYTPEFF